MNDGGPGTGGRARSLVLFRGAPVGRRREPPHGRPTTRVRRSVRSPEGIGIRRRRLVDANGNGALRINPCRCQIPAIHFRTSGPDQAAYSVDEGGEDGAEDGT